jgi:hypothetical protein
MDFFFILVALVFPCLAVIVIDSDGAKITYELPSDHMRDVNEMRNNLPPRTRLEELDFKDVILEELGILPLEFFRNAASLDQLKQICPVLRKSHGTGRRHLTVALAVVLEAISKRKKQLQDQPDLAAPAKVECETFNSPSKNSSTWIFGSLNDPSIGNADSPVAAQSKPVVVHHTKFGRPQEPLAPQDSGRGYFTPQIPRKGGDPRVFHTPQVARKGKRDNSSSLSIGAHPSSTRQRQTFDDAVIAMNDAMAEHGSKTINHDDGLMFEFELN